MAMVQVGVSTGETTTLSLEKLALQEDNYQISMTMVGFFTFLLCSMYLLRSSNANLRTACWLSVNKSMSAFIGVLIKSSVNQTVAHVAKTDVAGVDLGYKCFIQAVQASGWWWALQLGTAWTIRIVTIPHMLNQISGGYFKIPEEQPDTHRVRSKLKSDEETHQVANHVESLGTCLAFTLGSSSKSVFAIIQKMGENGDNENLYLFGTIPLTYLFLFFITRLGDRLRSALAGGDGIISERESAWGAYMILAEDKVAGLIGGHLMTQAIIRKLTHKDAGDTGAWPTNARRNLEYAEWLSLWVILFSFLSILSLSLPDHMGRFKRWFKLSCGIVAALCMNHIIAIVTIRYFDDDDEGSFTRVNQTLLATVAGAFLMLILTQVEEYFGNMNNPHGRKIAAAVHEFFVPIVVLMGFAWRDEFKGDLKTIVAQRPLKIGDWKMHPSYQVSLASIALLVLVVPAWKWFLLPSASVKWVSNDQLDVWMDSLKAVRKPPRWVSEAGATESEWKDDMGRGHSHVFRALLSEAKDIGRDAFATTKKAGDGLQRGLEATGKHARIIHGGLKEGLNDRWQRVSFTPKGVAFTQNLGLPLANGFSSPRATEDPHQWTSS